ncbi:MAG: glycosyltransferase, partial [Saprospiraceae bacterium]|nr:glycosyltransferase [Saprospiraceae bacterium]
REFADHFPTYILDGINGSFSDAKKMDRFLNKLTVLTPLRKSLVNSAESRNILPHLRKNGVEKVIYLIHEMGNTAEENAWSIINQMSDEVIFPASVVMSKALTNSNFDLAKLHVISQGLLNEAIYSFDPEVSRIFLQKELQLPTNAKIVLGCGQAIKRKGPDLFVLTAFGVLQRYTGSEPVYFIWMGEEPKRAMDLWLNRDIELSGFRDRIRFIGPREDVNHYFVGSDIFFLTSRSDPHPCVVHEATAAGLPIVGFENTGGVVGMVYQENADIVPYADIHCASEKILQHLYNPSLAQQNRERTVRFARENLDFSTYTDEIYRLMED